MISRENFFEKHKKCFLCGWLNTDLKDQYLFIWSCINCRLYQHGLWPSFVFVNNILDGCSITSVRFEVFIGLREWPKIILTIRRNYKEIIFSEELNDSLDNFLNKSYIENLFQTLDLFS